MIIYMIMLCYLTTVIEWCRDIAFHFYGSAFSVRYCNVCILDYINLNAHYVVLTCILIIITVRCVPFQSAIIV